MCQLGETNVRKKCPYPYEDGRLNEREKQVCVYTHQSKRPQEHELGNSFTNLDLADVTTRHIWPQRRLCAAGGLSDMKGCNPQLNYVARPVLSMRRWIGFSLPQTLQRPKDLPPRLGESHAFYNFNWIS